MEMGLMVNVELMYVIAIVVGLILGFCVLLYVLSKPSKMIEDPEVVKKLTQAANIINALKQENIRLRSKSELYDDLLLEVGGDEENRHQNAIRSIQQIKVLKTGLDSSWEIE